MGFIHRAALLLYVSGEIHMRLNGLLRALLAGTTVMVLAAAYVAPFGCRGGDCCTSDHQSQHMQHHGAPEHSPQQGTDSVSDRVPADGCPMMVACGASTVASVVVVQSVVPAIPVHANGILPSSDAGLGRVLSPLTPPPKA
jgi:hypothetical protein